MRGPGQGTRPIEILERLRALILTGEYGPDERLIEEQLAERLGVSRTPVRQALTMLEAEGLVEIAPNRGATVCSFSIEDVWDIYDLRAVLEGHAARRAAGRIEKRDLKRLQELAAERSGEQTAHLDDAYAFEGTGPVAPLSHSNPPSGLL